MTEDNNIEHIESDLEDYYSDDDLYNIVSWGADLSYRELITMYDENELIKPEIQRKYVWNKSEASRFIESILMGLPVPNIFLAKKGETKLIVDGYQRIMTVRDYVKGVFTKDNSIFGLTNSEKINARWRGKTFQQLKPDEQRRIKSSTIHTIIFEQRHPKNSDTSMYQIFERINTGGRILTPQEIRNCVYQGKFNTLLIELNKNKFWRDLYGRNEEDFRMRDIEFILRFFALNSKEIWDREKGQISLKRHLNLFMDEKNLESDEVLNEMKNDFVDTIKFIHENIGLDAFKNLSQKDPNVVVDRFHPTIFDAISLATFLAIKNSGITNTEDLSDRRINLLLDEDFQKYISERTTNIENIKGRIRYALKYLYKIDDLI